MKNNFTGFSALEDISKAEAVSLSDREVPESTYELFKRSSEKWGDRTALSFFQDCSEGADIWRLNYRELFERINQTANAFYSLGIRETDTIAILLPNCLENMIGLWAGEVAGISMPVNPMLDSHHIAELLRSADAKAVITLAPQSNAPLFNKVVGIQSAVSEIEHVITVDLSGYGGKRVDQEASSADYLSDKVVDFSAITNREPKDHLVSGREISGADIASYFHTGGSTGTPKIAPHTHANECSNAMMLSMAAAFSEQDVGLCGLPLFHVNATMVTGLAPFLVGAEVLIASSEGFRNPQLISDFWRLTEKYKLSYFSGVPTIYSDLLKNKIGNYCVDSLRISFCGGAPMPIEVINSFEEKTGVKILEGYGMTEGSAGSFSNPLNGDRRVGSVGIRLPYQQCRIVREQEGSKGCIDCGVEEIGKIVIKGPNVFPGYKKEANNQEVWIDNGWFDTGDLGRFDKDGYLWLTGRSKDLIIRGGHNIDPKTIEDTLHKHPAVHLAAAVGKPDSRVGEVPVAYIQVKGEGSFSEQDMIAFCTENISERAAVPKRIIVIDEMPLTGVGKIFKPRLRYNAIELAFKDSLAPLNSKGVEFNVSVDDDERFGQLAEIEISGSSEGDLESTVSDLLKGYSVRYQLSLV